MKIHWTYCDYIQKYTYIYLYWFKFPHVISSYQCLAFKLRQHSSVGVSKQNGKSAEVRTIIILICVLVCFTAPVHNSYCLRIVYALCTKIKSSKLLIEWMANNNWVWLCGERDATDGERNSARLIKCLVESGQGLIILQHKSNFKHVFTYVQA